MFKWTIASPDMILFNGSVFTADTEDRICQAVAISENKIYATGSDVEIRALATEKTQIIDLKGRTAIPGINDSHTHVWQAGIMLDGLVLYGIDSIELLKDKLRDYSKDLSKGRWIQGGSFIESQFKENRPITRYDLDEGAPNNPVVLDRIFGSCTVNTLALELAGISKDTPDPKLGLIEKDPITGEPNGILHRNAMLLVKDVMTGALGDDDYADQNKEASVEAMQRAVLRGMREYTKYGVTSAMEPGVSDTVCKAYHNLFDKGELSLRISLMPNWFGFTLVQNDDELYGLIKNYNFHSAYGNEWLRYAGLKMAIDGGLTSGTALKSWPYKGEDKTREFSLRLDIEKLDEYVKLAHDSGWDVGIHVMGDIAIEKAVNAIYKAVMNKPRNHRHHIIHAYYPTPDVLQKMKQAKILVAAQGSFLYGEADGYGDLLPSDKQVSFTPLRTYKNHGVTVALSTDMPSASLNPFWNMYAVVTRKGMRGYSLGEDECLTILEAVKMMTYNGAVLDGEETIKGSLEPGKLADIAVLDRSLLNIDPEEIKNITVDFTILDGKVIYKK